MNIPIMMGALIIGVLLIVLKVAKVGKTKQTGQTFLVLGIAFLAVAGLAYAGMIPQNYELDLGTQQTLTTTQPTTSSPSTTICAVEDTTVTLSAVNKYTSAASGGNHRYSVNGAPAKTVADAGTFTASPGDTIEILWFNESATSFFGQVDNVVVPCAGTKTFDAELVQNSTLTFSAWNEEGQLIGQTTNTEYNETLGIGDVVTLDVEVKGAYQKEFPYGFVLVIETNKSCLDEVILADSSGIELPSAAVPSVYSAGFGGVAQTKAYLFPPLVGTSKWYGTITLDASDDEEPGTSNACDVNLSWYARDYFIDDKNGGAFSGPAAEDEDDTATRGRIVDNIWID